MKHISRDLRRDDDNNNSRFVYASTMNEIVFIENTRKNKLNILFTALKNSTL